MALVTQRSLILGLIVGGFVLFVVGAVIYVSHGPMDLDAEAGRQAYSEALTATYWIARFIAVGVAIGAAGTVALASRVRNPFAWAGAAFWVIAATFCAIDYVGGQIAARHAIEVWQRTGSMPAGFESWDAVQGGLYHAYMLFGFMGTALVGLGAVFTRGAAAKLGWFALAVGGVLAATVLAGASYIPAVVQLPTLIVAAIAGQGPDVAD